jgi:D-3-phosphoglycerate dehydrogenase
LDKAKALIKADDYSEPVFLNCHEIKSKKFGVIGLGRIGSRIAEIALAFGADVYYWSRNRKKDIEKKGIKYQDIDKLLMECDILSMNLALTKQTECFMNADFIDKIKPGALLLNLAPNDLVDLKALENRLKKGDMTYIFDHVDELSVEQAKLFSSYKNCVIYPPIGFQTEEARTAKQEIFVGNIENFLQGTPINMVG